MPTLSDCATGAALAHSYLYHCLTQAYADPTEHAWQRLSTTDFQQSFGAAVSTLAGPSSALANSGRALQSQMRPEAYEPFLTAYLTAFGHAARGRCPLNEIEYSDIKADPLFQPHRLADLAAFYRAFGLEIGGSADERHDHICVELEFLCVLCAKEAYAVEYYLDGDQLEICRQAQKQFLREHLARWTPAFTRRLERMAGNGPLAALAQFTRTFIETECARFGLEPGCEDLLLRPVDEAAEALCSSCGLGQVSPGTASL